MWQSEWLHMLISIINHQGQRCLMIERGGTSPREEGKAMTEMKDSSRILTFGKYISRFQIHLNLSILGSPGPGNIAGIARNKRNSVINTRLNCHSELSHNSNLMCRSHSECEGKLG